MTKRHSRTLDFDEAINRLRTPDCVLVEMKIPNTKFGRQFFVVPGGPISDEVAQQVLAHPLCHEVDSGLFPGIPQSYSLWRGGK